MNKTAVITTIIAVLTLGGYLFYDKFVDSDKRDIWDYISENAAIVVELGEIDDIDNNKLLGEEFDLLSPFVSSTIDSLIYSDFKNKAFSKLLVSLHQTSNTSLGMTYFVDFSDVSKSVLLSFFMNRELEIESRRYLDEIIKELEVDNIKISFLIYNNKLFFSTHPFLIEDIVRLSNTDGLSKFKQTNADIMLMPKLVNDAANIYLNVDRVSLLLSSFIDGRAEDVKEFAKSIFFDASISLDQWSFNGFTQYTSKDFLYTFKGQVPVEDKFDYIIPTNAALVSKSLTSNAVLWENKLVDYWTINEPDFLLSRNDFFKKYDFKINEFFEQIKDGICHIFFYDNPSNDKLVYVSLKDKNAVLNQLNNFTESMATILNDSVYVEQYGDYFIQEIKVADFPKYLFGPEYSGFKTTYFAIVDDVLILANEISILKSLFRKIENEETWGRKLSFSNFLDSGLEEINFTYILNLQQLWPELLDILNPKWRQYAQSHISEIKKYKLWMLAFSEIDNSFYTNLSINKQNPTELASGTTFQTDQSLVFNSPLVSEPYVVRNHNTNLLETVVQDSLFNLHLISSEGKHLWTTQLDGLITSGFEQVDFYKNGKLQYFITTNKSIYVIDRLGNYVEGYPKSLNFEISSSSVVDYDRSKKYRFLISDTKGNLHLYDKQGKNLEGWQPFTVNGIHSFTPFHQRVRGRDSFIYLLQNGAFNMINRRGEIVNGFPIKLDGSFTSDVFVTVGSDLNSSWVTSVSNEGKLMKVNFAGKLISESQLFKQGKETRFQLIPDALGKSYLIARQEENRIVILDENGTEKFAKDYLGLGDIKLQYYYFSPENQVCVVTDILQGLTYLYNSDGLLLNARPIDSTDKIGLLYSESKNEYTVFTVSNNTFKKLKF